MPSKHVSIQTGLVLKDVDIRTDTAADASGLDVGDSMSLALRLFHPLLAAVDATPAGLAKLIGYQHHLVLNPIIQF